MSTLVGNHVEQDYASESFKSQKKELNSTERMKNDIQQAKSVGLESPTELELRSPAITGKWINLGFGSTDYLPLSRVNNAGE